MRSCSALALVVWAALASVACEDQAPPNNDAGSGEEELACARFGGLYEGPLSCTDGQSFPERLCVRQTSCDVEAFDAHTYTGTATFEAATFAAPSPQPDCTLTSTSTDAAHDLSCQYDNGPGNDPVCSGELTRMDTAGEEPCCDVVAQECSGAERCQIVELGGVMTTACIAAGGNVGLGESCERMDGLGRDNCRAGLVCVNFGHPAQDIRSCQPLCHDTSDCGADESCVSPTGPNSSLPMAGVCTPTCAPLANAGTPGACPDDTVCALMRAIEGEALLYTLACSFSNDTAGPDEACNFNNDCQSGLVCATGVCKSFCDAANPCPVGESCNSLGVPKVSTLAADLRRCG